MIAGSFGRIGQDAKSEKFANLGGSPLRRRSSS